MPTPAVNLSIFHNAGAYFYGGSQERKAVTAFNLTGGHALGSPCPNPIAAGGGRLDTLSQVALGIALLFLAPLAVGVLMGFDRKITARMQNRVGPPLLQPFYDVLKLLGKERKLLSQAQSYFALACLMFEAASLGGPGFRR